MKQSRFFVACMFCMAISAEAQQNRRVKAPPGATVSPPDREEVLRQLTESGARVMENPPAFSCLAAAKGQRFKNALQVNFVGRPQGEGREGEVPLDLSPWLGELFARGVQFDVEGWASVNRRMAAVARYSSGARDATVYVDRQSGTIARVLMRGFNAPEGVVSLQCWATPR